MNRRLQIVAYIILTAILILTKSAELFSKYSFSGFMTSEILLCVWIISTIYLIYKYWTSNIVKTYFFTLIMIYVLMSVFAGILAFPLLVEVLGLGTTKKFKLDKGIIIQSKKSPLAGPYILIFDDNGIFKKRIGHQKDNLLKNDSKNLRIENASKAVLIEKNNDFIAVKYYWGIDTLTIKHKIKEN